MTGSTRLLAVGLEESQADEEVLGGGTHSCGCCLQMHEKLG